VADEENYGILVKCLNSIKKNTPKELYELIIVDNGSNYGIEEMKDSADNYLRYDKPLGYTKAVNIGLNAAKGKYLCVFNNDLFVNKGWLEQMLEDLDKSGFDAIMPMDRGMEMYHTEAESGKFYENWVWGALWIIKRDIYEKVGQMDEELNWRFSDQDYWIKIKMSGFRLGRTGNVVVDHVLGATYNKMGKIGSSEEVSESEEMNRRYKVNTFDKWFKLNYGGND
jgi:GT2 family glycosyltransferase